jgi:predicted TIM-barrel fold metal-dependent hydrolase
MHDLEEVSEKCPGKIFPFLAVDPRRIGIQKLIEMKINKGNGVFKGIKLYPPLGYLPTHPDLEQIYKYCEQHQIPITVHCSDGGIKNFKGKNYIRSFDSEVVEQVVDFNESGINKSRFYAAPNNWKFVLSRYPELRINFAHFGGGDNLWSGDSRWMEDILNLTAAYENVYTDFSYYTKPELADKIGEIVQRHPVLNNKLMFGTDFIMILLDHDLGTAGGLREYFTRFSGLDRSLLCGNAKRFLKI